MDAACSSQTSVNIFIRICGVTSQKTRCYHHEKLISHNFLGCQKDNNFDMPSAEKEVSSSGCPYVQVICPQTDFEMMAKNGVLFFCPEARNISV
jgi:hypothetical protein